MVQSRLGQNFSRTFPAIGNFVPSLHGHWNVNFPLHAVGEEARTLVAKAGSINISDSDTQIDQQWLVREISSLKRQVRKLEDQSLAKRQVSSVDVPARKLRGLYLQLHSFKEDSWDMPSISSEVKKISTADRSQSLQVCLKNEEKGNPWTRVFWGPFQNKKEAEVASKKIQRQTILVSDPSCRFND